MNKPKLLDQVRNLVRMRHLSCSTEKSYVYYIRNFILFHKKRHPAEMGIAEIREYLTHLAVNERVAASTQNVAFNAILFLYKQVLEIDLTGPRRAEKLCFSGKLPYFSRLRRPLNGGIAAKDILSSLSEKLFRSAKKYQIYSPQNKNFVKSPLDA